MDPIKAKELILRYNEGNCTAEEKLLVERWELALEESGEVSWSDEKIEELGQLMKASLFETINRGETIITPKVHRIHFRRSRWWAAAAIIFLLGTGSYLFFFQKTDKKSGMAKLEEIQDIKAPKITRAMITLADGRIVSVDSLTSIAQGDVHVTKTANGKIIYQGISREVLYNTLSNPIGSNVIDMALADGSHVWLNAGSSLTYPVAFIGNERKVSFTGEAYFEVTHDASKPFFVSKGDVNVQVLGTHFNIKAFDDEADIKVTLLEGSVKVDKGNYTNILKPSQQAQVSNNSIKVVDDVDLKAVIAWKNGFFNFSNADIQTLMREMARWYDVEVIYEGAVPKLRFGGELPRTTNLLQAMEIFKTSGMNFRIQGRKVTIKE